MNALIKEDLHKLIDDCGDELLLVEANNILQAERLEDWWDELTEDDKTSSQHLSSSMSKGILLASRN